MKQQSTVVLQHSDEELSEIACFLSFFADELKLGICPEQAFTYALSKYNGVLKPHFMKAVRQLFVGALPLKQILKDLALSLNNLNSRYLLQLTCKFLEKDSIEAGKVLLSMVRALEENNNLIKKRNHFLRAKNLKTKILSLGTSLVMGYITALTPLFSMLFLLRQQNFSDLINNLAFNPLSFWPAFVGFFFIGIFTAYQLTEFTDGESSWSMLILSAMIFFITFLLTHSLLKILLW